jgi:hypothetical protein
MKSYQERLLAAAQRYKDIQEQHPRKAWGEISDGHANIPNTAEVLAVLRCAHEAYDATAVQDGLDYLATRVFLHPRPMGQPGGHWPLTRFLVYGLIGLTQWPEWERDRRARRHDRISEAVTVPRAVDHCVSWLGGNRSGDGWPDRADRAACSVLQTATAILALDRVGRLPEEVRAARDLLVKVQNRTTGAWPEVVKRGSYREAGSAPHTALAVLALSNGNTQHRQHAARGGDWLLTNIDRWQLATNPERHEGVEPWIHMTFALGLRACLRVGTDPLSGALGASIDFLDRLWDDGTHEWRGGESARPSVHGSHAVVLAYEELKRSQRYVDPLVFFTLARTGMAAAATHQTNYRFTLGDRTIAIIDGRSGESFPPMELGELSWELVRQVAKLQFQGSRPKATIPLSRLAGVSRDVRTMIRRINRVVAEGTEGQVKCVISVARGGSSCSLTVKPYDKAKGAPADQDQDVQ